MTDSDKYEASSTPPTADVFDNEVVEEIMAFLHGMGGVVLLDELAKESKRFVGLEEELEMSSATLNERLEEASDCDLIKIDVRLRGEKGRKFYKLSPRGETVYAELQKTDLIRIQRRIWELKREFQVGLDELDETIRERLDELNNDYLTRLPDDF